MCPSYIQDARFLKVKSAPKYTENCITLECYCHTHPPTLDPALSPPHAIKYYTQSFHTLSSLYLRRKRPNPPKVTDTGSPPKEREREREREREDECDSQTRPQEFMHPQEEYLHLHTSHWIQLSHCLHITFVLETE